MSLLLSAEFEQCWVVSMHSVLVVVFDGLRPDMIRPDVTPNLMRFSVMGTRMPKARSVFPSETRVCTASVSTGCYPRAHGVVANRMFHPLDPTRRIQTGNGQELRAFEQESGTALVMRPGLSDLLAASGRDFVVFSSGSTGQTFVLAPRADELGQIVVSAHGPQASSEAGRALLARLDPPPRAPAARAVWIADAWRTTMLAAPPAASVLWLCEPDTSAHYEGLGSPGNQEALRAADAAFGRILDDWADSDQADWLQIIVASDHGHVSVDGLFDLRAALAQAPELRGCEIEGGASGGIHVPGAARDGIAEVAQFLMRQDWVANVFCSDITDPPHGALPLSAALIDHKRSGHVLYTMRNGGGLGAAGLPSTSLPGTSLIDSASGLGVGAGTHGGLNAREMSTVLMLAGSRVKPGSVSNWPAGLVDIAPTILAILGLAGGVLMDGRVLSEALEEGAEPLESRGPETWEASSGQPGGYAQRIARMRVGRHVWIDEAVRE